MTIELALIEHALQGLTMDVVINLTEHVQTLELRPNGQLFTAYRILIKHFDWIQRRLGG